MEGRTIEQIVAVAAGILDDLRYVDVETTFDVLCELFPGAESEAERNRLLRSFESLSKHELAIWKQAGPVVQHRLIRKIQGLCAETLISLRPVLIEVSRQVLLPERTGTSSTYDAVTLHRGAVGASRELAQARSGAIDLLKTLFGDAHNDIERREVIQALSAATATPDRGLCSDELLTNILDDTRTIVDFYTEMATAQSYELLQELEDDLLRLYRLNCDMPSEIAGTSDIANARKALAESILAFRDCVNGNEEFLVHKTLVGYQSVFPPAWENDGFEFEHQEAYRNRRIEEFVAEVTEETAEHWFAIMKRCAQTKSSDLATFPSFHRFLERLGRVKPQIMARYLDRLDAGLAEHLVPMLKGLDQSHSKDFAKEWIRKNIEDGNHLRQIIWYLRSSVTFDPQMLISALEIAIRSTDDQAIANAISAAAIRHEDSQVDLVEAVLLPAIDYFKAKGETRWVNAIWPRAMESSLFRDLQEDHAEAVLSAMVRCPQIDHRAEEILTAIAQKYPAMVVEFFGQRLAVSKEGDAGARFESVQFQFHDLHEPLATIPDRLVKAAREWFNDDARSFAYRGARFLANIFPRFSQDFEKCLMSYLDGDDRTDDDRTDIDFVLKVLRAYEGEPFLYELCKKIIDRLPECPSGDFLNLQNRLADLGLRGRNRL